MDEIQNCGNCKHFNQHYYWFGDKLTKVHGGHCVQHRKLKLVFYSSNCKLWEPAEFKRFPPDEAFAGLIKRAAKQIIEIAEILKL